jgi:hypothetical protein
MKEALQACHAVVALGYLILSSVKRSALNYRAPVAGCLLQNAHGSYLHISLCEHDKGTCI